MGRSMNTEQAAEYLGYSRQHLANWRVKGGGPTFIKSGRVTYDIDDLDQWKQDRKRRSTSDPGVTSGSSSAVA